MGTTVGLEAPALDGAREALALGGAGHVDLHTLREDLGGQLLAGLEILYVLGANFGEVTTRRHTGLGEMTGHRLGHLTRVDLAVAKLDGLVAVGLLVLHSRDDVGRDLDERDGNEEAVFVPNLRHAELLAQQCVAILVLRHCGSSSPYSLISMLTSAGRSICMRESTAFGVGSTISMRRL